MSHNGEVSVIEESVWEAVRNLSKKLSGADMVVWV
jgi:hypothetical protein